MVKFQSALYLITVFFIGTTTVFANGANTEADQVLLPHSAFYVGGSAGYGDTHWKNFYDNWKYAYSDYFTQYSKEINTLDDDGFAGRVYLGFSFNRYIAIESGWTYLPKAKLVDHTIVDGGKEFTTHPRICNYVVDFLVKLSVPVYKGLNLYTKVGGGYFDSEIKGESVNPETGKTGPETFSLMNYNAEDTGNSHFGPVYGVGAEYNINQYFSVDVSWMRFSGYGKFPTAKSTKVLYQPNPDVVLAGVTFHIPTQLFRRS